MTALTKVHIYTYITTLLNGGFGLRLQMLQEHPIKMPLVAIWI